MSKQILDRRVLPVGSEAPLFAPLARSNYSDRIIDQIRGMIADKKLLPGDKLPAERELAIQFGVSRASIREAVRSLVTMELLESRTGAGTYVTSDLHSVLSPLSWVMSLTPDLEPDLHEARKYLEPRIAAMAAERATPEEHKKLLTHVQAMHAALGDTVRLAEADFRFHIELARSAHNRVFEEIIVGLQALLKGLIAKRISDSTARQLVCYGEHLELYEAIVAHDAERARGIMAHSVGDYGLFQDEGYQRELGG
jgi:GntR family transcriptional regulator, transcriptional repressor for pyruvate dehydrogenase complex